MKKKVHTFVFVLLSNRKRILLAFLLFVFDSHSHISTQNRTRIQMPDLHDTQSVPKDNNRPVTHSLTHTLFISVSLSLCVTIFSFLLLFFWCAYQSERNRWKCRQTSRHVCLCTHSARTNEKSILWLLFYGLWSVQLSHRLMILWCCAIVFFFFKVVNGENSILITHLAYIVCIDSCRRRFHNFYVVKCIDHMYEQHLCLFICNSFFEIWKGDYRRIIKWGIKIYRMSFGMRCKHTQIQICVLRESLRTFLFNLTADGVYLFIDWAWDPTWNSTEKLYAVLCMWTCTCTCTCGHGNFAVIAIHWPNRFAGNITCLCTHITIDEFS